MGADQGLTRLFYDAECARCCRAIRFLARHDPSGRIHFAPLGGSTYARLIQAPGTGPRPDSLLALTPAGDLLDRSRALRHLLSRMGLGWRVLGAALGWLPVQAGDLAYDLVARHRTRRGFCERPDPAMGARFEP